MATSVYRGLEIYPLVYPHRTASLGCGHNYDDGFNASVKIIESEPSAGVARSRVFNVPARRPFLNAGDARRAAIAFGQQLIDASSVDAKMLEISD